METVTEENETGFEESTYEQRGEEESQTLIMDLGSSTREKRKRGEFNARFINGLAVGFGIGCIATFVILWAALFFSPQLPEAATYENLLSVFIYPLLYLLTLGLVSITAGLVKENSMKEKQ